MADAIISDIKGTAYVERNGTRVKLTAESEIQADDVVITDADASVELRFSDGAVVRVGASSTLEVAEYVYTETDSSFVLNLTGGMMRSVSGAIVQQNPEAFQITTPRGTIGIRGTDTLHEIRSGGEVHAIMSIGQGHTVVITDRSGQSVVLSASSEGVDLGDGVAMRMVQVPQQALAEFVNVLESGASPGDVGNALYNAIHSKQNGQEDAPQEGEQTVPQDNAPQDGAQQGTGEGTQSNVAPVSATHLSQTATEGPVVSLDLSGVDAVVAAVIKLLTQAQTIVLSTLSVNSAEAAELSDLTPMAAVGRIVESHLATLEGMGFETGDNLFISQNTSESPRPAPSEPKTPEETTQDPTPVPPPTTTPEEPAPEEPKPGEPAPEEPKPEEPAPEEPKPEEPAPEEPKPEEPAPEEPKPEEPAPEEPGTGGGGGGGGGGGVTPPPSTLPEKPITGNYTYEFSAGSERIIGDGSSVVSLPESNLTVQVESPTKLKISNGVDNNTLELENVKEISVRGSGGTLDVSSAEGRVVLEATTGGAHRLVVTADTRAASEISFTNFGTVSGSGAGEIEIGGVSSLNVDLTGTGIGLVTTGGPTQHLDFVGVTSFKAAPSTGELTGTTLNFDSLDLSASAVFKDGALQIQHSGDTLAFADLSVKAMGINDIITLSGDVTVRAANPEDPAVTAVTTLSDGSGSIHLTGMETYVLSKTTDVNFFNGLDDTVTLGVGDGGLQLTANGTGFIGKLDPAGVGTLSGGAGSTGDEFIIGNIGVAELNAKTGGLTDGHSLNIESLQGFDKITLVAASDGLTINLDETKSETVTFTDDGFSISGSSVFENTVFSSSSGLKIEGFTFGNGTDESGPTDVLLLESGDFFLNDGIRPAPGTGFIEWGRIKDWNVALKIDGSGTYSVLKMSPDAPSENQIFRLGDISGAGSGLSKLELTGYGTGDLSLGVDAENNLQITVDQDGTGPNSTTITLILEGHTVGTGAGDAQAVYSALVASGAINGPHS